MAELTPRQWLQTHVNDFCAQTGQRDVRLETMLDLLYDLDQEMTDRLLLEPDITPETVLRPGAVPVPEADDG